MARKFYFSTLVRRPLTLSGRVFTFEICSISGGSASGVYATDNPDEIVVLDDAARGRRGVSEITEAVYAESLEKKKRTPRSSNTSVSPQRLARPSIAPPISVDEKTGVLSAAEPKPAADQTAFTGDIPTRPTIENLIRIKRLSPPKPFAESDAKVAKASKRADRAKVRVARASVANSPEA